MKHCYLMLLALVWIGCSTPSTVSLHVDGDAFVDNLGREVVFNGINHVHKSLANNYINPADSSIFKMYEKHGFNFIRFGVYWRALEPQPGQFDQQYLEKIDQRMSWARECGLWVMLDLHQDLYLEAAPQWAVLTDGLPHITGEVWSDAYMISPAVHAAFDSFWADRKAADSVGIQTRYVEMLAMLAARYRDSAAVVGYDVMNEPFAGSSAVQVMPTMMEAYRVASKSNLSIEQLAQQWSSTQGRLSFMDELNDKELFSNITSGMAAIVDEFEQGALSKFYQRARDAVRGAGSSQILFLEHSYFCNIGVKSTFKVPADSTGARDMQCAYAPHGYDLVTDTNGDSKPGTQRVDFIFEQIMRSAVDRNMPVVVGEWGAFYGGAYDYTEPARHIVEIVERGKMGQAYWCYWTGVEQNNYFTNLLARSYPMAVNGRLVAYANDFDNRSMVMEWNENDDTAPTIIFLPKNEVTVEIEPQSDYTITDNRLIIAPVGNAPRKLTITKL